MRSFKELQTEVIHNRAKRGWSSATDINCTISGLAEELGEFARAVREGEPKAMAKELADVAIFCLGGFEILGVDGHEVIDRVVAENAERAYKTHH